MSSLDILTSIKSKRVDEFKTKASQLFPLAIAFQSANTTTVAANGTEGGAEKENIED